MNNVQILGTITRDLELKYTQTGTAILSFSIAYNEKYKKQDGSYEDKAMFFDVTAFGKRGETINQYFNKGSRILISGSLDYQSWSDQQGNKKSKVGIKLNDFDFIDKKTDSHQSAPTGNQAPTYYENSQNRQTSAPQQPVPKPIEISDEQIPF